MPNRRTILGLALSSPLILSTRPLWAAASPEVFNTGGVAINGYDPVGYFDEGKPVEGSIDLQMKWMGAIWRFASPDHMLAFEMNPHRFAPEYGGYCAYAVSQGAIATTVPEAWTVHDDKLYLNFSTGVRTIWQKDIPGYVEAANKNWPEVLSGPVGG